MDIRKISMFLAWKLPPYYNNRESNLYAFKKFLSSKISNTEYTTEEMNFILQQAKNKDEDVYFMVLDDLWNNVLDKSEELKISKNDFIRLLIDFWIPNEVLDIEKKEEVKYTWADFDKLLIKKYWDTPTTNNKWDLFEELCFDILKIVWWFTNVKKASAWADWWIDITANFRLPIWSNTDIKLWFFWQSKYKSIWKVQVDEVNILTTTISNDTAQKYQWVFYFTNSEYAPKAREALDNISHSTSNRKCFWLDWNDILRVISENKELYKKYKI